MEFPQPREFETHDDYYDAMILAQLRMKERFTELAYEMAEECGPMWWQDHGDGEGSVAIEIIRQAFTDLGYSQPSVYTPPKRSNRKRISARKRLNVYERDGYACVTCGTHENLTIDHIHPVSKGGTNDMDNLQTMCHSCNARKGAKIVEGGA